MPTTCVMNTCFDIWQHTERSRCRLSGPAVNKVACFHALVSWTILNYLRLLIQVYLILIRACLVYFNSLLVFLVWQLYRCCFLQMTCYFEITDTCWGWNLTEIHSPPKGCMLLLWIKLCMFAWGRPLCTDLSDFGVWKPNYLAPGSDLLDELPCWGALCPCWHFYYKPFLLLAQLHLLQGDLADPNLTFYIYPVQDSRISLSISCLRLDGV